MKLKLFFCLFMVPFLSTNLLYSDSKKDCIECVKTQMAKIPGWCSPQKAEAMIELIFETKPKVCVELGVFAGASLFPTAMALRYVNQGMVYGIDAWSTEEAIKYYEESNPNRQWWKQQDMNSYYLNCVKIIKKYDLKNCCSLIRETFANALAMIDVIDILHIDATHTKEGDFIDVLPFCAKVKMGGYIWFDGWANSSLLYDHLKTHFHLKKVINSGQCILLQRV